MNSNGLDLFHVHYYGFYLRDTYDFNNESEFLGVWSKKDVLGKVGTAEYYINMNDKAFEGYVRVYNRDFRRWQTVHQSGGDFVVYSDVKWKPVSDVYVNL